MRLPITPATTLWRSLRDEVRHNNPAGRIVLAVDAPDAAASGAFADGFAEILAEDGSAVVRAAMRDFALPRRDIAEGGLPYDVATFRRVLIDPFRDGAQTSAATGFQLAAYDADRDAPVEAEWTTVPRDAVLVVSGTRLQADALRRIWNWSVWLETGAPHTLGEARGASAIVDVTDPAAPTRVYRDFC